MPGQSQFSPPRERTATPRLVTNLTENSFLIGKKHVQEIDEFLELAYYYSSDGK
jgi:hypothetical protein